MSLSDFHQYVPKAPAASHRTYRVQVAPLSGTTANPSDRISFDVPTGNGRRNVFLDASESFITFQLKNSSATAVSLAVDSTGYSLFDSLTTLSGGNILEQVNDYGSMVNAIFDAQLNNQEAAGEGSVLYGCAYTSDQAVNFDKTGQTLTQNAVLDMSLPLVCSGIFSGAATKHIPVGLMSDLRLELVLAALNSGVYSAGAASWLLQNIVLNLTYTEIDNGSADALYNAVGGVYRVSTEGWRNYSTITSASRNADTVLVPARFSSVKSLGAYWRPSADLTDLTQYSQGNRVNRFPTDGTKFSVQWSVGSALIPAQPITLQSEVLQMVRQGFHQLGDVSHASRICRTNWLNSASSTTNDEIGTFLTMVNCDQIIGKNLSMTSGFSTLSSPVILNVAYGAGVSTADRVNSFSQYDAVLEVSQDGTFMRY